jgi:hypothetical protein
MDETRNGWPIPKWIEHARSITTWKKARFVPKDSEVHHRTPSGEVLNPEPSVLKDGWDHEHCMLCMAEISLYPGTQTEGYSDEDGDEWLCAECYEKYLAPSQPD